MVGILNDSPGQVLAGEAQMLSDAVGQVVVGKVAVPIVRRIGSAISTKITRQRTARGRTKEAVEEAIASGNRVAATNKANGSPASRTAQSVVVDDVTGEVIHVGGPGFQYGPGAGDFP